MISYIFHNETRSEIASKKLYIQRDEIMNSLFSGAYFKAIIKANDWNKSDVICAISDDTDVFTLVYENEEITFCEDTIHCEKFENTLNKKNQYDLSQEDNLIIIKCPEEGIIINCGNTNDIFDSETEYDDESDVEYESETEYIESDIDEDEEDDEEDIEEDIWVLRKKMTGLKNITRDKIQNVRDSYFKLSGKKNNKHLKVELGMDILKYLWKLVIREFITAEHFEELCYEIFIFIERNLVHIESYMRIEYENFRHDILKISTKN